MTDLIAMRERPPRFGGDAPWERYRRIGLLIDWLDSRPEHAAKDAAALQRKAKRGDMVAAAAAVISERLEPTWLSLDGPIDHQLEYRPYYHSEIAGYLHGDELDLGSEVYRRLNEVDPNCMSGLFNLAELARRNAHETDAFELLRSALDRASGSPVSRYGIANANWSLEIRCALALLAHDVGESSALLECAVPDRLVDLVALLRGIGSTEHAALRANQAFSVASDEQRIVLHAAMRLAPIAPRPPPAAHARFEAIQQVDALVRDQRTRGAK
jgi:hypothetical protein